MRTAMAAERAGRDEVGRRTAEVRGQPPVGKALRLLGPGLITGAADDDPSGIATYAVAGATAGLGVLWTALLTFPFMTAVQIIADRIAMVSGKGFAAVIKARFPRWVAYGTAVLVLVANTINVGADLGAMADAVHTMTGYEAPWLVIPIAIAIVLGLGLASYEVIVNVFKWLTLALFAYVVDAFLVRPDLRETALATIVPKLSLDPDYVRILIAILGTTISPYLFFWQSSQEVEEQKHAAPPRRRRAPWHRFWLWRARTAPDREIKYATIDTIAGMAVSQIVMYFIILATALTLFKNGGDIKSGADAAQALRPLAGDFAAALFALGILGAGLLAIPVLSGSAAYVLAEVFGWRRGLDEKWWRAKSFYAALALSTLVGMLLNFTGINPIDALVITAVIMGVTAPPLLALLMIVARDRQLMGEHRIGPVLTALGWLVTVAMTLNLLGFAYTSLVAR